MALLTFKFTKLHIIILGTITLALCFILLFMLKDKTNQPTHTTKVQTATAESLQKDFGSSLEKVNTGNSTNAWVVDKFVIVDIRPSEAYSKSHIKGSISAPLADLKYSMLDPDVDMVVYGEKQEDVDSAVEILSDKNIRTIHQLNAPIETLKNKGYEITEPTE